MSKVENYRVKLKTLESWDTFLLEESNLPGPRGNLELAFAVAREGDETLFLRYARLDERSAPTNTREEFLAFCGVLGLGYLLASGAEHYLTLLRKHASDPRWRIREAVAMGLQKVGQEDMDCLLRIMDSWKEGALLERRAVVAGLCEPVLLMEEEHAGRILDILDSITSSVENEVDRKSGDFKTLRKGLGYGWSVVVVAQPELGKERFERWVQVGDKDIRWIVKENLKKNRLVRMDKTWVEVQMQALKN